jgi:hypothetical protein
VRTIRDQYIAHRDRAASGIVFPQIDIAMNVVEALRDVLKELIDDVAVQHGPGIPAVDGWQQYFAEKPNSSIDVASAAQFRRGLDRAGAWLSAVEDQKALKRKAQPA